MHSKRVIYFIFLFDYYTPQLCDVGVCARQFDINCEMGGKGYADGHSFFVFTKEILWKVF